LRPHVDESKSAWVFFPQVQASYFLPIVKRSRLISPVINDDGSIEVITEDRDKELGAMSDRFIMALASPDRHKNISVDQLKDFYQLVYRLVTTNYDLPKEKVQRLMAMNEKTLDNFISAIYLHCTGV